MQVRGNALLLGLSLCGENFSHQLTLQGIRNLLTHIPREAGNPCLSETWGGERVSLSVSGRD